MCGVDEVPFFDGLMTVVSRQTHPTANVPSQILNQNKGSEGDITPPINVLIFIIGTETVLTCNLLNRDCTGIQRNYDSDHQYHLLL